MVFRYSVKFMNARGYDVQKSGYVFGNSAEEARACLDDEYGEKYIQHMSEVNVIEDQS